MKKTLVIALLLSLFAFLSYAGDAVTIGLGKKVKIDEVYSFQCEFVESPKLGRTATMRVTVFNDKGDKVTNMRISALTYMTTMKGMHDDKSTFMLNTSNATYLAPVRFVMRGDYRTDITFTIGEKEVFVASVPTRL